MRSIGGPLSLGSILGLPKCIYNLKFQLKNIVDSMCIRVNIVDTTLSSLKV